MPELQAWPLLEPEHRYLVVVDRPSVEHPFAATAASAPAPKLVNLLRP